MRWLAFAPGGRRRHHETIGDASFADTPKTSTIGTWDADITFFDGEKPTGKAKGVQVNKLLANGHWVSNVFTIPAIDKFPPYEGHGVWGYDTVAKTYVNTWVDTNDRVDPKALRRNFVLQLLVGLRVVWPILSALTGIFVVLGLVVGVREGWSVQESIYFSFVTALTIGYGDLAPKTLLTRTPAILIGTCGVLVTALIAAVAVKALSSARDNSSRPPADDDAAQSSAQPDGPMVSIASSKSMRSLQTQHFTRCRAARADRLHGPRNSRLPSP